MILDATKQAQFVEFITVSSLTTSPLSPPLGWMCAHLFIFVFTYFISWTIFQILFMKQPLSHLFLYDQARCLVSAQWCMCYYKDKTGVPHWKVTFVQVVPKYLFFNFSCVFHVTPRGLQCQRVREDCRDRNHVRSKVKTLCTDIRLEESKLSLHSTLRLMPRPCCLPFQPKS